MAIEWAKMGETILTALGTGVAKEAGGRAVSAAADKIEGVPQPLTGTQLGLQDRAYQKALYPHLSDPERKGTGGVSGAIEVQKAQSKVQRRQLAANAVEGAAQRQTSERIADKQIAAQRANAVTAGMSSLITQRPEIQPAELEQYRKALQGETLDLSGIANRSDHARARQLEAQIRKLEIDTRHVQQVTRTEKWRTAMAEAENEIAQTKSLHQPGISKADLQVRQADAIIKNVLAKYADWVAPTSLAAKAIAGVTGVGAAAGTAYKLYKWMKGKNLDDLLNEARKLARKQGIDLDKVLGKQPARGAARPSGVTPPRTKQPSMKSTPPSESSALWRDKDGKAHWIDPNTGEILSSFD